MNGSLVSSLTSDFFSMDNGVSATLLGGDLFTLLEPLDVDVLGSLDGALQHHRLLLLNLLDDWSLPVKQIKIKYDIFSISEHIEKIQITIF